MGRGAGNGSDGTHPVDTIAAAALLFLVTIVTAMLIMRRPQNHQQRAREHNGIACLHTPGSHSTYFCSASVPRDSLSLSLSLSLVSLA